MKIEQFEDKELSHYSYAILSECENEIILVDPARDLSPYIQFAKRNEASITGVIETHPHADFVSGHAELARLTGAIIYCSKLTGASYTHRAFDDGDVISFGEIKLKAVNTPGHSPDSICIIVEHDGKDIAAFTGDTLFIGDCGRPDLRENAGNITAKREELAARMYHSLREKLMPLPHNLLVYPAHGAGSLCGKALSEANYSTIGAEKLGNWSLQEMSKEEFIAAILKDQPFVPKYFPYDVGLNKNGASNLASSVANIAHGGGMDLNSNIFIIDGRPEDKFKKGYLRKSINLQTGGKFETWLGSIVAPGEPFYLTAENEDILESLKIRCAKIGYEGFIEQAFIFGGGTEVIKPIDIDRFAANLQDFTIVDIRNGGEIKEQAIFENAINIPLYELRERAFEIPCNKPIVVHCAGGYRSAAGISIIRAVLDDKAEVYDLGGHVKDFINYRLVQDL